MIHFRFAAGLAGAAVLATAPAQALVFTVAATVDSDPTGLYSIGQSIELQFTVNPSFDSNSALAEYFGGSYLRSRTESTSESSVWSDFTATGLTGAWALPDSSLGAPFDYVETQFGSDRLRLLVGSDSGESLGLSANGADLTTVWMESSFVGLDFVDPGAYATPEAYYSSLYGTYAVNSANSTYISTTGGTINLSVTSLTIAAAAIPEPGSLGLLIGLGAVGLAARRRR